MSVDCTTNGIITFKDKDLSYLLRSALHQYDPSANLVATDDNKFKFDLFGRYQIIDDLCNFLKDEKDSIEKATISFTVTEFDGADKPFRQIVRLENGNITTECFELKHMKFED